MFAIGDHVVYPMHGAGVVQAVEEREFELCPTRYLVLNLFIGHMTVRIPVQNIEKVGLRPVSSVKKMREVKKVLQTDVQNNMKSITWNRRFTLYIDKMKAAISWTWPRSSVFWRGRTRRNACPRASGVFWATPGRFWRVKS